jgi:putative polyketide hydroxylase
MGTIYSSAAVIDDGTEVIASTVTDYVETGRPGARAPHVTLADGAGRHTSTIDICSQTFAFLTHDRAGSTFSQDLVPLAIVAVGPDGSHREVDRPWHEAYGVTPTGAVLIRPDGHVAARFNVLPADPARAVTTVVVALLGLDAGS